MLCFSGEERKTEQIWSRIGGRAIDLKYNGNEEPDRQQENRIATYLDKLKFKKRLFGVDEADVWKKIQELNNLYEEALRWERKRYDLLLEERAKVREDVSEK